TIAHNGLCGVGREEDWITHSMEHEISAWDDKIAHGEGLAVLFPAWMTYMADHNPGKVAQLGERVFGLPEGGDKRATALEAANKLRKFFNSIGMPSRLSGFGIKESDIDALVAKYHKNNGQVIEHRYLTITPEVSKAIYSIAL
ncbi:MAG: iron-containing alcohol dehydrogenase, partial [Bacteroidaceae bacterium]|nr:iron-containing alcohol dehydrogenase [Bacteroidaceae bacterium]